MDEFAGYRVAKLFDPVQTHVIHGVSKDNLDELKSELRLAGAIRFRVVKNRVLKDCVSLCFKLK